jgi:lysophospholipase L1-like esterase
MNKVVLLPAPLLAFAAWAQELHPALFEDGDRVFFAGDSITHIGKYQVFIADYYATRFPKRRITFLNGGIGGDTAGLALKRMDRDIAAAQPTKVTVMLGMNDAGGDTLCAQPQQETLRARALQVERYKREWPELIEALRKRGMPVTPIAPSPCDDTAQMVKPALAEKGRAYRLLAEMNSTAAVFQPGHKIAIHITSSNSPKFERHTNTWLPVPSYEQSIIAQNSVYLDAAHPSALILPVTKTGVK